MRCEKVFLSEVCDLVPGYAFRGKDFGDFKDKVIKITHITPPTVDMDNLVGIDIDKYDISKLKKFIAQKGDYVLAMTGATIGKIGRVERGCAYVNQRVLLFKNKKCVDKNYLYYVLKQKEFEQYVFNHIDSNSAQPNISASTIGNFSFDLPDLVFQKKIGDGLRLLDEKIATNRAINDNLEQQAVTLVAEYAERTPYSSAFSDIMNFDNGFAFQSSTYLSNGKYKIITIKNVQDGYIDSTGSAFIDSLPQRMKDNCILNIGDVLLSLTGNVGRVGVVCEENLLLNQRVAKIVPYDNKLLPFLYFVFRQSGTKTRLETIAKGTAQLNLSPIETLKLTIPYEESSAIQLSQLLEPLYRKIINNNQESCFFALLRDTLLPKLMSGEIDASAV